MSDRHPHDPIIDRVRKAVVTAIESGLPGPSVMLPAADLFIVLRNLDAAREGYAQASRVHEHKCAEFVHLRQKHDDLTEAHAALQKKEAELRQTWHATCRDVTDAYARGKAEATLPSVDILAQIIRTVDGDNSLGAGALAEKIIAEVLDLSLKVRSFADEHAGLEAEVSGQGGGA